MSYIKGLGWKPELPDHRDHLYKMSKAVTLQSVDLTLTKKMPPIWDQDQLGSCTGFGIARVLTYCALNGLFDHIPRISMPFSPLFIYYIERLIEGNIPWDDGAFIRDGIKGVSKYGACSEAAWPYFIEKFATEPRAAAFRSALDYMAIEYQRIDNTYKPMMVDALMQGYPIVHGFSCYQSIDTLEVAQSGNVPYPGPGEEQVGGHCTVTVGYDASNDRFKDANSWSSQWGKSGYFTTPASYWTNPNLADDFWIVKVLK